MATFNISSLTIPGGNNTFGPFSTTGGWSHFTLVLDITNVTIMDIACELSTDGGTNWRFLVGETGTIMSTNPMTGLPNDTLGLSANWTPPLPAGLVRVRINNAAPFVSGGGSVTVT